MAVGTPLAPVIIFYDNYDSTQESYAVAMQLRTSLSQQQISCAAVPYKDALDLAANLPQYLILVYSAQAQRLPQVDDVIDKTLDLIVRRQMKSIVAVMATPVNSSPAAVSLPAKWASVPTYNASSYLDKSKLAGDVVREAAYVKLPYSQESSSSSRPGTQGLVGGRWGSKSPPLIWTAGIVIMLLLVIAGTLAFVLLSPSQSASISATNRATGSAVPGAAPDLEQNGLKEITQARPTVTGFQKSSGWAVSNKSDNACASNDTSYIVAIKQPAQYQPCLATGLSYKNFALQVTMDIKGDAGGVIFRSNNGMYYRLGYRTDTSAFNLVLCDKGACLTNGTNMGTVVGTPESTRVDEKPLVITVVVRDKDIDIYADQGFVTRFTDGANIATGQIGVYAADISTATSVTFSDLKIWSLDRK